MLYMQEAARQARKRSASTMEDATFVGEAIEANAQQTGAADEQLSAEQQFQTELLEELKVKSMTLSPILFAHSSAAGPQI